MNYKEGWALAQVVLAVAPWAEDVYVVPLNPAERGSRSDPHMVSLSSEYLRADFYSPEDWLALVRQLEPTSGPTGLPLIEQSRFDAWVREQLARTDVDDREQRCSTKDLSLFAHRPYLNTLCVEVPYSTTIAPVVDSADSTPQVEQLPTVPEITLTLRWICPGCDRSLVLSRRLPTWLDVRISLPGPAHTAPGSEEPCSTETWVILEEDEEVDQEKEVHFFVQVWQVIHLHQAIDRAEGEQTGTDAGV
jgi:hypothetical protein